MACYQIILKLLFIVSRMLWDKGVGEFVGNLQKLSNSNIPETAKISVLGPLGEQNIVNKKSKEMEAWENGGISEYCDRLMMLKH